MTEVLILSTFFSQGEFFNVLILLASNQTQNFESQFWNCTKWQKVSMDRSAYGTMSTVVSLITFLCFYFLVIQWSSTAAEESPQILALSPPTFMSRPIPTARNVRFEKICSRRSFSKKSRIPANAKLYTVAELQLATNSFSEENLLGEGSLGSVYKGEFPDGQVLPELNMLSLASFKHIERE